ncbi:MAG: response regulator transcription factor [Paludibacter sp.]|nr:response regulator transcription factor [Paludibacter sp.]
MNSKTLKVPNIILVEDHTIFRQGIKAIINFENLGTVIGEASNGKDFIDMISVSSPDLVLMDIEMPDMNGIEATKRALNLNPDLRVIAFTGYADQEYFHLMVELGVKGFILKTEGLKELEIAIRKVMHGERYFSHELHQPDNNNNVPDDRIVIKDIDIGTQISNRKLMFFPWNCGREKITITQDN